MGDDFVKYLIQSFIEIGWAVVYILTFAFFGVELWEYAVVPIFGLPEITYWQMLSLMVLVRLLIPSKVNYKDWLV